MAIVPIRNLGGGAVDTSKKYLYKKGVKKVEWDNGTYNNASKFSLIGGWTENADNLSAQTTTNMTTRTMITENAIDVTDYSSLKFAYNNGKTLSIDVSSKSGSYYISVTRCNENGYGYFQGDISTQKTNFGQYSIGSLNDSTLGTSEVTVTEIWLEK